MQKDIIKNKIKKANQLAQQLYRHDIITNAYIVGSTVKGTARENSDIDIYLIHPSFQKTIDLNPYIAKELSAYMNLYNILKDMGVEFRKISLKEITFWYQLYMGEIFHLMTDTNKENIINREHFLEIKKD